jgi:hypothetical protein
MVIALRWLIPSSHSLSSLLQDDVTKVLAECRAGNFNLILGMLPWLSNPQIMSSIQEMILHSRFPIVMHFCR